MNNRAALLVVVALLLAACGDGPAPFERVAEAAERTTQAGSAKFAMQQDLRGGAIAGAGAEITGEGVVDFDGQRGRVVMDMSGLLESSGAGGRAGGPTSVEVLFEREMLYLKVPGLGMPTEWVRLDVEDLPDTQGAAALRDQFSNTDPSQGLALLHGVAEGVERVGEDQVRGVATTHYRFTLDLEKAAREASGDARAFVDRTIEQLGVREMPGEVWLDEENRVRRQSYTIDLSRAQAAGAAAAGPDAVTVTVEYFDFGTQVDVAPPPPSQVTDFSTLVEQRGGATPGATP